jgi:hypothetical protein
MEAGGQFIQVSLSPGDYILQGPSDDLQRHRFLPVKRRALAGAAFSNVKDRAAAIAVMRWKKASRFWSESMWQICV